VKPRFAIVIAALALSACGGGLSSALPQDGIPLGGHQAGSSPIQHIVLVIQENRSFDNLFATFPGARGAKTGLFKTSSGDKKQKLSAGNLFLPNDVTHCNAAFKVAYDGGKMDGFSEERYGVCGKGGTIGTGTPVGKYVYTYVKPAQIKPYWDIAKEWVLADELFQTQGSGSFVAHQDLIRGGSAVDGSASDPNGTESLIDNPSQMPWGCDSVSSSTTQLITISGKYLTNGPFPCSNQFPSYGSGQYLTLRDTLDSAGLSWKYYSPCYFYSPGSCNTSKRNAGATLNAFDVIYPVRYGPEWGTNVSMPETNIFNDITKGSLPAVSWVIPEDKNSDHPGDTIQGPVDHGPQWVASVVNAIGESTYWNSTAVIIVWDDWGGFYDNAKPPFQDNYGGLGFRVPMLVVSPYARIAAGKKHGFITHTQYEFGSILKYIEHNFNLPLLGTTDKRATSIGNIFNYNQAARPFIAIPSSLGPQYFRTHSGTPQHGDPE
jgi:phospholipase C